MCIDVVQFLFVINALIIIFTLKQTLFVLHVLPYAGIIGNLIHLLVASLIQRKTGDGFAICVLRLFGGKDHKIRPKPDTRKYPRYVIAIMMMMSEFAVLNAFMNVYMFVTRSDMEPSQSFLDSNFNN